MSPTSRYPSFFTGMLSSPKVMREKNEALTRFLRAYIESMALIRRDKEAAVKAMGRFLNPPTAKCWSRFMMSIAMCFQSRR